MSRVIAVFNVDTNFNFKQRLNQDLKMQSKDKNASFEMFMKHVFKEKKVNIHE